jgi:transcriptional regulator with XRE-family HTH domain
MPGREAAAVTTAHLFGRNLFHLRCASGLTQEQLASLCELYRSEVSLLERGGREPRLGTLVKLAAALSVDLGTLLEAIPAIPAILA